MTENRLNPYAYCVSLLLYGILCFSSLTQGNLSGWSQTAVTCMTLLAIMVLLLEKINTDRQAGYFTTFAIPFVSLILWFCFTLVSTELLFAAINPAFLLLTCIGIFYITIASTRSRKQQRILVYVVVTVAVVLSLKALVTEIEVLPFSLGNSGHQTGQAAQVKFVFASGNHFAGYLNMVIPLLLGLMLSRTYTGLPLLCLIFCGLVFGAAHFFTFSLWGWAAIFIALVVMGISLLIQQRYRRKGLIMAIFGGAVLLHLFLLINSEFVLLLRNLVEEEMFQGKGEQKLALSGVLEMIKSYPLTGSGPGTFSAMFTQYQPPGSEIRIVYAYNDYLHYMAEYGIPIMFLILWFIYLICKTGIKKLRVGSRQTWGLTLGAMTSCIALLIHSGGDTILHIPANAILLTVIVALIVTKIDHRSAHAPQEEI